MFHYSDTIKKVSYFNYTFASKHATFNNCILQPNYNENSQNVQKF